jgi:DNA-binding NarL/FixJ family response regulator
VLIVDHHEQIRRLVRAFFLSEFGFQICGQAVDGYEAIMKAQLLKPDLVVLEVAIPPLSGVEAAPKLRKLLPKTPIISIHSTRKPAQKLRYPNGVVGNSSRLVA